MSDATGLALGIDIGGSGIKGAPVDLVTGRLATDRLRIDTPQPSTPEAVVDVISTIVDTFADQIGPGGAIGVTIPGVVMHGVVQTAANIDPAWKGCPMEEILEQRLQRDIVVVNDADAAGVGELHYGAAKGHKGLVIMTTLGTGIGSAVIHDGVLVPNSEYGHLELDGHDAESRAAASIKKREGLSWEEYAKRLSRYYQHLEFITWPDLFVIGGGVSKKPEKFLPLIECRTPLLAATLANEAGIIGAAKLATDAQQVRGRHTA